MGTRKGESEVSVPGFGSELPKASDLSLAREGGECEMWSGDGGVNSISAGSKPFCAVVGGARRHSGYSFSKRSIMRERVESRN